MISHENQSVKIYIYIYIYIYIVVTNQLFSVAILMADITQNIVSYHNFVTYKI